jgi:surfeit locus 1 family protein
VRAFLTPRMLGAHLLALVLVAVALLLAAWQFAAWDARRDAEARDLSRIEPVAVTDALGPDDPFLGDLVGQPVVLEGRWLPDATVLVSGRESDGRDGFWVVTPLQEDATGSALPVVRGWTADESDVPPAPTGEAAMVAYLQPPEGRVITDADPTDDVVPQLRTADLQQRVEVDLYGAYAVIPPPADDAIAPGDWPHGQDAVNDGTDGLEPATVEQLPPVGQTTALRNLLYGIEWVVFGGFAGFIWWQFVRDSRRSRGEDGADPEPSTQPDPVGSEP